MYERSNAVIIDKEEYNELLEAKVMLEALHAAGVDNWDGYEYAQEVFEATISY